MPSLIIKDIAILAQSSTTHVPIGEAPGEDEEYSAITPEERNDTLTRLQSSIFTLMENAAQVHNEHLQNTTTESDHANYITRLSTNEFFFYTKEPLSMQEFELLQEQVLQKAKTIPNGVHLALASFAVELPGEGVLNVTPFITCGDPPGAKFIVKNNAAPIDVSYRDSLGRTKDQLDNSTYLDNEESITLLGEDYPLSLNNLVACRTPGGEPFLTAVDICLDHTENTTKENLTNLTEQQPEVLDQPISQIVLSNTVSLRPDACFGQVMHTDPDNSYAKFEQIGAQSSVELTLNFGKDKTCMHTLRPVTQQTLRDAILDNHKNLDSLITSKQKSFLKNISESSTRYDALVKFEQEAEDMGKEFILDKARKLKSSVQESIEIYQEFLEQINTLESLLNQLETLKLSENDYMMVHYINKKVVNFCNEDNPQYSALILYDIAEDIESLNHVANSLNSYASNHMNFTNSKRNQLDAINAKYCVTTKVNDRVALSNDISQVQTEVNSNTTKTSFTDFKKKVREVNDSFSSNADNTNDDDSTGNTPKG